MLHIIVILYLAVVSLFVIIYVPKLQHHISHNCDFLTVATLFLTCDYLSELRLYMSQYGLMYYFYLTAISYIFFSNVKTFFIHQYSEHPEDYANRSSALNSELKYKDTLVKLYV